MAPIRYATSDGLRIAYQVSGDGPVDVVLVTEWSTPLEARWEVPAIAGALERLGSFARVISFDKRGIGESDGAPSDDVGTPEVWVRDLVAVLDAAGSQRVVAFGAHDGGPIACLFAASCPERCDGLVLVNTGARLVQTTDYPIGFEPREWRPDLDGITEAWESGTGGEYHIHATNTDPWWRDWYGRSRRQQASPAVGLALFVMLGDIDVRRVLGSIRAPTLVLHRTANRFWPVEQGRRLASAVPDAHLVELAGVDNYWWAGDPDSVLDEVEQFVVGERRSLHSERVLATLLFTDIVDSTGRLAAVGDDRWRRLLDQHDELTARAVARFGGRVVKRLGDGMLATFDGPARAITAAQAIAETASVAGLAVRACVHTGEVERRARDIGGIAVHIAARMLDVAEPGEVLVSGVVKGLVAGSGITFEPRGTHHLRGIPDTWDLFAVA